MENQNKNKMHPMLIVTCVVVIIACLFGIASAVGWIGGNKNEPSQVLVEPAPLPVQKEDNLATVEEIEKAKNADEKKVVPKEENKVVPPKKAEPKKPAPVVKEPKPQVCANCGVIESVQLVENKGNTSGLGAVGGAVVGGLLGNQIGKGSGNTAATVAGAVGGGYLGNRLEGNRNITHYYNVRVKYNDDTYQTFKFDEPIFNVGQRVRLNGSVLEAY